MICLLSPNGSRCLAQLKDARTEKTQDCTVRHCVTVRSPHQVGTPPIHASWVALSLIRLHNLENYILSYFLSLYSILSAYLLLCKFLFLHPLASLKICIFMHFSLETAPFVYKDCLQHCPERQFQHLAALVLFTRWYGHIRIGWWYARPIRVDLNVAFVALFGVKA